MPQGLRRRVAILKVVILLGALLVLLRGLHAPIDGEHYFRQTHVEANIERFVSRGISLRPTTYNYDAPLALFDFPAYEVIVAAVCRVFGTPPLETSRLLNVLFFVLSFAAVNHLLERTGVRPVACLATLFFFAFSPLNLYFMGNPLPDPLAVCAALGSLVAFVAWDRSGGSAAFAAFCLLGILSTLVKNPVYLGIAVALPVYVWLRRGLVGFARVSLWALLIVLSVVVFKVYSNAVNDVPVFMTSDEAGQYFGEFSQRFDLWRWESVLRNLSKALNPLALSLALLGIPFYAASRSRAPYRGLYMGLSAGCAVTVLVFFSRFTWHDYYHLPLVFPLAFFAGDCADRLRRRLGRRPFAQAAFLVALGVASLFLSRGGYLRFVSGLKPGQTTKGLQVAGSWIRDRTDPGDFVVYVVDDHENWNPAYLYFAKRDGFNLHLHGLSRKALGQLRSKFSPGHGRFFVFCPAVLSRQCQTRLKIPQENQDEPGFLLAPPEAVVR
jgi:hypothetical protein